MWIELDIRSVFRSFICIFVAKKDWEKNALQKQMNNERNGKPRLKSFSCRFIHMWIRFCINLCSHILTHSTRYLFTKLVSHVNRLFTFTEANNANFELFRSTHKSHCRNNETRFTHRTTFANTHTTGKMS